MRIEHTGLCDCGEPLSPDDGGCELCRIEAEGDAAYEAWVEDERVRETDRRATLATAGEPWWAQ